MEKILLQPARSGSGALDFTYASGGVHTDVFVADRLWQLLHASEFDSALFTTSLRGAVVEAKDQLRRSCARDQIPYVRSMEGIRYFTFAGYLVNKAVGLISGKLGFQADDLSLLVSSPIDWPAIPTDPTAYQPVFHLLFESSSEQSVYQQQLPTDLQQREYLQDWLRDETIPQILERLVHSTTVKVDASTVGPFSAV